LESDFWRWYIYKIFHTSPYISDNRHISIKPPHNRPRC
jgi:hypothetical protein